MNSIMNVSINFVFLLIYTHKSGEHCEQFSSCKSVLKLTEQINDGIFF